jgi:hypothetical protein
MTSTETPPLATFIRRMKAYCRVATKEASQDHYCPIRTAARQERVAGHEARINRESLEGNGDERVRGILLKEVSKDTMQTLAELGRQAQRATQQKEAQQ